MYENASISKREYINKEKTDKTCKVTDFYVIDIEKWKHDVHHGYTVTLAISYVLRQSYIDIYICIYIFIYIMGERFE